MHEYEGSCNVGLFRLLVISARNFFTSLVCLFKDLFAFNSTRILWNHFIAVKAAKNIIFCIYLIVILQNTAENYSLLVIKNGLSVH